MPVPDHSPISRRKQFQVKSKNKADKLAKKSAGEDSKTPSKGKGKGRKGAKKKGQESKKRKGQKGKKGGSPQKFLYKRLTSKRSLLRKAKQATKAKEEPGDQAEDHLHEPPASKVPKLPETEKLETLLEELFDAEINKAEPTQPTAEGEAQEPSASKQQGSAEMADHKKRAKTSGKSAKAKAAARNKPQGKARAAKAASEKATKAKKAAKEPKATKESKQKTRQPPSREQMINEAERALQGDLKQFKHNEMVERMPRYYM